MNVLHKLSTVSLSQLNSRPMKFTWLLVNWRLMFIEFPHPITNKKNMLLKHNLSFKFPRTVPFKPKLLFKIQLLWHIYTHKELNDRTRFKTMLSMIKSWASFSWNPPLRTPPRYKIILKLPEVTLVLKIPLKSYLIW